jgi:hypothetical protein
MLNIFQIFRFQVAAFYIYMSFVYRFCKSIHQHERNAADP